VWVSPRTPRSASRHPRPSTMAASRPPVFTDAAATLLTATLPPDVGADAALASAAIALPPGTRIYHRAFAPAPVQAVEHARREVARRCKPVALQGLLWTVRVGDDGARLDAFAVAGEDARENLVGELDSLEFDGLGGMHSYPLPICRAPHTLYDAGSDTFAFAPDELYPCSPQCALLAHPCPSCSKDGATPAFPAGTSNRASVLLPRKPLRERIELFLDALRNALLEDVMEQTTSVPGRTPLHRYQTGFLFSSAPPTPPWSRSWHKQPEM
jgi:mediator of RNA polymerase II transcription subunit 13